MIKIISSSTSNTRFSIKKEQVVRCQEITQADDTIDDIICQKFFITQHIQLPYNYNQKNENKADKTDDALF
jgi:hypothetical protein